ncbi:MAG TPA: serine/threonine-protein kinase [Polyangia bacterium]
MIEAQALPASDEVVPGQTIGKYEVLQRLAAGGMAEIFLARMVGVLGFDKLVVIKRILPHLASRNDFIAMFLDEARIGTTLNHANIVQTHEVGVHGKSYFMVMEYLAGEDVRSIVRRISRRAEARLPIAHALEIAIGVAAGLQYAHNKSDRDGKPLDIVHRDVTPQNVIVTYDGAVKLLDFGIAKAANRINETRSGSFKGKVPYMSPEQCRGEPLDRRSDIFSLGILLHELTLCRRLFKGETDFQILKQIAEGPIPSPREIDAAYDPRLSAIVMKALERDPARRFQSARELQEALAELGHELRLRMSPLALADYMQALFADKVGAWQKASAEGDVAELERHFATVMAEREADLADEEGEGKPLYLPPPPSDVQLSSLPDAELAPRRGGGARWLLALLGLAAALGAWRFAGTRDGSARAIVAPPRPVAASAPAASAPALPTELPTPDVAKDEAPATVPSVIPASVVVTTTPSGAQLVLDGKTLAERSPAHVDVAAGVAHTLLVRTANHPGVVQRFTLDAGEEATLEIDLRRSQHPAVRRASARPARAAAALPPPSTPAPPAPAPAPRGDGTLVLASSPWCTVTVDGQARGTTPISVKLKAGAHQVLLANPEYKIKRTLAVDIEPNQTVRKSLDFAPE